MTDVQIQVMLVEPNVFFIPGQPIRFRAYFYRNGGSIRDINNELWEDTMEIVNAKNYSIRFNPSTPKGAQCVVVNTTEKYKEFLVTVPKVDNYSISIIANGATNKIFKIEKADFFKVWELSATKPRNVLGAIDGFIKTDYTTLNNKFNDSVKYERVYI